MSLIHLNKRARINYFRKLVVTNILCSEEDERSCMVTPPAPEQDFSNLGMQFDNSSASALPLSPLLPVSPIGSLSPLPSYSQLTSECYAEELVKKA